MSIFLASSAEVGQVYTLNGVRVEFVGRGLKKFRGYYFFRSERAIYGVGKYQIIKKALQIFNDIL